LGIIRVGTCSWTDPTMARAWYPVKVRTPAGRLRFYAQHFDTVEVDSTFYALPSARNATLWAQRTPAGFTFHIKAFGLITRHSIPEGRLPPSLRHQFPYQLTRYGNVKNPPQDMITEVFRLFREGIEPLRLAGKLGLILLQFPPYFTAEDQGTRRRNAAWIVRCRRELADYRLAVEFRHRSWVEGSTRQWVLDFLRDHHCTFVCVDQPALPARNVLPRLTVATAEVAYVRFHGRNRSSWNRRTESAAERFKYLYTEEELREWVPALRALASQTRETFVMFNNCFGDYAPRNALQMRLLLEAD